MSEFIHERRKELTAEDLRYCLMPAANPNERVLAEHNKAFALWQQVWGAVFSQLQCDTGHMVDDFVRQDLIACLLQGEEPIAVHLYSFFSIDSDAARAHHYLKANYPEIFFAKLKTMNVRNVMSMEYMTLRPDRRKSKTPGPPIATVLGGLALKVMRHFGLEGAIAPARRDFKVHEMAHQYGGESVIANVMNHNVACDLIIVRDATVIPHPDAAVQTMVDALWHKREDHSQLQPSAKILPLLPQQKGNKNEKAVS